MKKTNQISVRINDLQFGFLKRVVESGEAKSVSEALQVILNKIVIFGESKK